MSPLRGFSAVVILASLSPVSSLSAQSSADAPLVESTRLSTTATMPRTAYSPRIPATEPPPAELADLNFSKFEKVYAAGLAVASAQYLRAVGVSPQKFQRLNRTFSKALATVAATAMTKREQALFERFQIASLKFELAIGQRTGVGLSGWKARKAMREATDLLEAANKIYLGNVAS